MTADDERTADLTVWQQRAAHWTDTVIVGDILEWRGLVLGEETGEVLEAAIAFTVATAKVQRALLKAQQGIRGGADHWAAELRKETGDAFFCLAALAHRAGFPLVDAVNDRWAVLRERTRETEQAPR